MRYIFYADVYFIQNFIMKISVLYLVLYSNKRWRISECKKQVFRICLVALMGTLVEIFGLFLPLSYSLFVFLLQLFEVPVMIFLVIGTKKKGFLLCCCSGYFYTLIINGVLEVLWNRLGEEGAYVFLLIFTCFAVSLGVRIWKNYSRIQKGIFDVVLLHEGRRLKTHGFYDSGNRLRDSYEKKGVHIVSNTLIDKWKGLGVKFDRKVYIPYQALGNETGLLEVYYVDAIIVDTERDRIRIEKCPVGVTKDNLFEGKNYEIILNEEVF